MVSSFYLSVITITFFVFSLFSFIVTQQSPLCHQDDSSALLQFKESLFIDCSASTDASAYPKVVSWRLAGGNGDCCSWDGVQCDNETGRVIELDLSSSCFYGPINSSNSLFRLVQLQSLTLADNNFTFSQIPSEFHRMERLSHLNLSLSHFSGQVPPEISQLWNLSVLDLSGNTGLEFRSLNLGSLVQNLTFLRQLDLSGVSILSTVPDLLANSTSLESLQLVECGLYGEFPIGIFQLPNLQILDVNFNHDLMGQLPDFHFSSSLEVLHIRHCNFSGQIPSSLGNLTNLVALDLSVNNFGGQSAASLSWVSKLPKITQLGLSGVNVYGEIPSSFANLTQVSFLRLCINQLTGPIPSWFASMTQLSNLYLCQNHLTGPIPSWFANLTNLEYLSLGVNKLSGSIPGSLMYLPQLVLLELGTNNLTGEIPSQPVNHTQLDFLDFSLNKLTGPIPTSIFELVSLDYLDLSSNELTGTVELAMFSRIRNLTTLHLSSNSLSFLPRTDPNSAIQRFQVLGLSSCNINEFPDFLQDQDRLEWLDLSANHLHGQIPEWMWNRNLGSLMFLNLSHNNLTGSEHHSLALPHSSLRIIDLRSNMLQGSLPMPPPSTTSFLASDNNLSGGISPWFCNLISLYALDLSDNFLTGMLPQCSDTFGDSLSILNLRNNKLQGSIPQTWTRGSQVKMIDLSNNELQGQIPRSLSNCTALEFLDLGNNHIKDTFPSWMGSLPNLKILILRFNEFHGVIGKQEMRNGFHELRIIDLSSNSFTGVLPSEYFQSWQAMKDADASIGSYMQDNKMSTMVPTIAYYGSYLYSLTVNNKGRELEYSKILDTFTVIDFSSNSLQGNLPESFGNLVAIHSLNLSNNNLTGSIPPSFGNLTELESLDLSHNMLSGNIPGQLIQLTFLQIFNVSFNHLSGLIPYGNQFNTFQNNSYEGNLELCGAPLSKECGSSNVPPPPPPSAVEDDQDSRSWIDSAWIIIVVGYGTGFVIGTAVGYIMLTREPSWFVELSRRLDKKTQRLNLAWRQRKKTRE